MKSYPTSPDHEDNYPRKRNNNNRSYVLKSSNKANTYSKNHDDVLLFVQELEQHNSNETVFYEKLKGQYETITKSIGYFLWKALEMIQEKGFSSFHFFKMLMNPRLRFKLKLINFEDEKYFYSQFWNALKDQKEAVQIQGLKILTFLTSDYLHNMSQQTQIDCIRHLKQFSNSKFNSTHKVWLSLNCIGNILSGTKYKLIDKSNELLLLLPDIFKSFPTTQRLDDSHKIQALLALLRILNLLHIDFQTFPNEICEFLAEQLVKYIFIGTKFFPYQKSASSFNLEKDFHFESNKSTSSSETSEGEELEDNKKSQEVFLEIRYYCASSLCHIFRHQTQLIPRFLPILFPNTFERKGCLKLLDTISEPLLFTKAESSPKVSRKEEFLKTIEPDFTDASLLYLLLFEENYKVKLSICKAITSVLEGYQLIEEKINSSQMDNEVSESQIPPQILSIFKNIALSITVSLLVEEDEACFNQLIILVSSLATSKIYETVCEETLPTLLRKILTQAVMKYSHQPIYLSCIYAFGVLANGKFKERGFEEIALCENFNIIQILYSTARATMNHIFFKKDTRIYKKERVTDSTILIETMISLLKFPKHYIERIIEGTETLMYLFENLQDADKKYANVIFKLVQETMKYITNNGNDTENSHYCDNFPALEQKERRNVPSSSDVIQEKLRNFHMFLSKIIQKVIIYPNNENTEYVLSILEFLDESLWELYYSDLKQKLLLQIPKLNRVQVLKQSLLKLLGKICSFSNFLQMKNFHQIIYNVYTSNNLEKNNNIMNKNSWVLANFCANNKTFDMFTMEQNQKTLSIILGHCNSSKEKQLSNGFRAFGYFISNCSDSMLCQMISQNNEKFEETRRSLKEIYLKQLDNLSVKVCWNICVSLSNTLKTFKPNFMKWFFQSAIVENLSQILVQKKNFKTQIHCVEMLSLVYKKFPEDPCFDYLPNVLLQIYFSAEEKNIDISESRYLRHLKESIHNLLIDIFETKLFKEVSEDSIKTLNTNANKVLQLLQDNIKKLYCQVEENDMKTSSVKEEDHKEMKSQNSSADNDLNLSISQLNSCKYVELKEYLQRVCRLSKKLVELIDSSDEIFISFALYEGFHQLSGVELENKNPNCKIQLRNLTCF